MDDDPLLHPEARRPPGIVAGDHVQAVAQQFGHQQTRVHLLQQGGEILAGGRHDEVVVAPGVAGTLHAQLAGAVAAQEVALQHPVPHHVPVPGGHALGVEGGGGKALLQERPLVQLEEGGKQRLAQAVEQEGRLAVQMPPRHGGHEAGDEARGDGGLEQHRALAGAELAAVETPHGPLPGPAPHAFRAVQIPGAPGGGVPVVPLHGPVLLGDHRAGQALPAGGIAGGKAQGIGVDEMGHLAG